MKQSKKANIINCLCYDRSLTIPELSSMVGCSSSEVSTILLELKKDGINIRKDDDDRYFSTDNIFPLNPKTLLENLALQDYYLNEKIVIFDSVDSTSDWLGRVNRNGDDIHGKVCITEFQRSGRGTRGRSWEGSPYRHIMFSIGWRFNHEINELNGLSLFVGVILASVLKNAGAVNVGLKWPNDLICPQGKLGGVLTELNSSSKNSIAIIGVGINYDEPHEIIKDEQRSVTDLKNQITVNLPSREYLIGTILKKLIFGLSDFQENGFKPYQNVWNSFDLFLGRKIQAETRNRIVEGISKGVDKDGTYLLETAENRILKLVTGDVSIHPATQDSKT